MKFKMEMADTGDFSSDSLASLNTKHRNDFIYGVWNKQRERFGKTLIFVGTQQHARDLAEVFGADADHVISGDGRSRDERRAAIDRFRTGDTAVLINVGIFKEGVDVPEIRTVILARPTASPVLYTQMVGRGSRVLPRKKFFYLVDIHDQLGEYEEYLTGVEDLADRNDNSLIEVNRRAAAAERTESSRVKSIAQDPRTLIELLSSDSRHILTDFVGWIAFETKDGIPMPIAGLLGRPAFTLLQRAADRTGVLNPSRRTYLAKQIAGQPPEILTRCLGALKDGLRGRLFAFQPGDEESLDALRKDVGEGLPKDEDLAQMRSVADHLQEWARAVRLSESRIGTLIQEATVTSATYAAVICLRESDTLPFARLLSAPEWKIIGSAIERSRAQKLTFADGPQIVMALKNLDPSWGSQGHALLDAIDRAGRGENIAGTI